MAERTDSEEMKLVALLDRAAQPDRYLDALIEVQARRFEAYAVGLNDATRAQWRARSDGLVHDPDSHYFAPSFTASMDAACELVGRLLPICSLRITIDPSGNGADLTWWPDGLTGGKRIQAEAVSVSPPLAILSATLRARAALQSEGAKQ